MKKLLVFITIGLLIVVLLNQLSIKAGSVYKDGASIICSGKRNMVRNQAIWADTSKATVLYFGASDMMAGIVPQKFDSLLGNQTYSINLALPALPIGPYYFYLKDYLARYKAPDYIIMSLHFDGNPEMIFDTYANQGIKFPGEVMSYFFNRKEKYQFVNYLLPCHVYKHATIQYLRDLIVDPQNIQLTKQRNEQIIDQMIKDRGYYFIAEQTLFPEGVLPEAYRDDDNCETCLKSYDNAKTDPYVRKFFNLARKKNIRVLLVNTPVRHGKYRQFDETPEAITYIVNKYDNVYMPGYQWKLRFYDNSLFSDPDHLNPLGGEKFTIEIASEFSKMFSFDMN